MARDRAVRKAELGLEVAAGAASRLEELTLDEVEAVLIRKALARFDGNVNHAARELGLSRSALYRRLVKHGLSYRE